MTELRKVERYGWQMWEVPITVRGLTPLLMNNPLKMGTTIGGGRSQKPSPEEDAASSIYRGEDGVLYVPSIALRNAVINGASKGSFKLGKKGAKGLLTAGMTLEPEDTLSLWSKDAPVKSWAIDTRRAVVQGQGIMRTRAKIEVPWELRLNVLVDATVFPTQKHLAILGEIIRYSGSFVGLLDYRPFCPKGIGGWFGKFTAHLKGVDDAEG